LRVARYAMPAATRSRAAKAMNAFSRPGFFFVAVTGGVESRGSSLGVVAFLDVLIPDDLGDARFAERGVDGFTGVDADFSAIGAVSVAAGLLVVAAGVALATGVGFCGAEAVRARALRARISLRCARDGFLLTIRRYSKQVRSGKTPALWGMNARPRHNVAPTS
jgi:hypothetical protein